MLASSRSTDDLNNKYVSSLMDAFHKKRKIQKKIKLRIAQSILFSIPFIFSWWKQNHHASGSLKHYYWWIYFTHWQNILNMLPSSLALSASMIAFLVPTEDNYPLYEILTLEDTMLDTRSYRHSARAMAIRYVQIAYHSANYLDNPSMTLSLLTAVLWITLLAPTSHETGLDLIEYGMPWVVHACSALTKIHDYKGDRKHLFFTLAYVAAYVIFTAVFIATGKTNEYGEPYIYPGFSIVHKKFFLLLTLAAGIGAIAFTFLPNIIPCCLEHDKDNGLIQDTPSRAENTEENSMTDYLMSAEKPQNPQPHCFSRILQRFNFFKPQAAYPGLLDDDKTLDAISMTLY